MRRRRPDAGEARLISYTMPTFSDMGPELERMLTESRLRRDDTAWFAADAAVLCAASPESKVDPARFLPRTPEIALSWAAEG